MSVIIPTYNWSSVLRYAIASVLRQTYGRLELIVVGDACTDDSEDVVGSFEDERVRWHNLPVNSGSQGAPNNAGLSLARGEIVAYLGHDDLWFPTHLAHLVATLERTPVAAAWTVCEAIGPRGSNVRRLGGLDPRWVPPSALAHRAGVIEEIGEWRDYRSMVQPPDAEFVARLVDSRSGGVGIPALTVLKFNAAWRPNSYRLRLSDEQASYTEALLRPRHLLLRELGAYAWLTVRQPPINLPELDEPPEVVPPGWHVTQWRRVRGLPEQPAQEVGDARES